MQWVRTVLGTVNRNKMMLIINSSAALLKDLFLQHMQKVKVTTLWNFCWLPHLFIMNSLDADGKNSSFWDNVCGRWSLQSRSLALNQLDLLGEILLMQSFPSTASSTMMSQCKRNYCAVIPPLEPLRHFEVEFLPWFLGPEKLLGFSPPSSPFLHSQGKNKTFIHMLVLYIYQHEI